MKLDIKGLSGLTVWYKAPPAASLGWGPVLSTIHIHILTPAVPRGLEHQGGTHTVPAELQGHLAPLPTSRSTWQHPPGPGPGPGSNGEGAPGSCWKDAGDEERQMKVPCGLVAQLSVE